MGFLSLALQPTASPLLSRDVMLEFNYRLSLRGAKSVLLHNAHPREDAAQWERIPPEHREKIPPAPPQDAPAAERIARAGGEFRMSELLDLLLGALSPMGLSFTQSGLGVFTVVRLSADADLASADVRHEVGPLLAALAQIEERNHAGALPDQLNVPAQILNRRHWTASSTFGSAHVVVDQPSTAAGDVEFNHERVPRVFNKYFMTFAAALLQRLIVQQITERAARLVSRPLHEYGEELQELRRELLEFSIACAFEPLSMRHAVQRTFHVVREGMESQLSGAQVRAAIAELDAKLANDQRRELAERTAKSLEVAVETQQNSLKTQKAALRTQHIAEQLEIIILAVYAAELWHILTSHPVHETHGSDEASPTSWFGQLLAVVQGFDRGALIAAGVGLVIGFLLVYRPWAKQSHNH